MLERSANGMLLSHAKWHTYVRRFCTEHNWKLKAATYRKLALFRSKFLLCGLANVHEMSEGSCALKIIITARVNGVKKYNGLKLGHVESFKYLLHIFLCFIRRIKWRLFLFIVSTFFHISVIEFCQPDRFRWQCFFVERKRNVYSKGANIEMLLRQHMQVQKRVQAWPVLILYFN